MKIATSPAPVAGLDHRLGRARGDVRRKPQDVTREDDAARSTSSDFLQTLSGKPTKGPRGDKEEFLASQREDRTPVANEPHGIPVEKDELRVAEDEVPRVLQEGGQVKGRKAEEPECSFLSCSGGGHIITKKQSSIPQVARKFWFWIRSISPCIRANKEVIDSIVVAATIYLVYPGAQLFL